MYWYVQITYQHTIERHVFEDSSKDGISVVLYAVVHQTSGTNQGLIALPWLEGRASRAATSNILM